MGHIDHRNVQHLPQKRYFDTQRFSELSIEIRQRFVEQKELWPTYDRPANRHPLHLPARELRRRPIEQVFNTQKPRRPIDALVDFSLRQSSIRRPKRKFQITPHAPIRIEREMLKDEGHVARRRQPAGNLLAPHLDPPRVRRLQPGDDSQERGLSRPCWPQDEQHLILAQGQIYAGQSLIRAKAPYDAFEFQPRLHYSRPRPITAKGITTAAPRSPDQK